MKQSPQLQRIQNNMRPGVIALEGFLGTDRRMLGDILLADDAAVHRLGLTHKQIAARMQLFRDAGAKGLGIEIHVAAHFEVAVDGVRGILPCPFEDQVALHKVNTTVMNERLGESITFTDLGIHLVAMHGFYGGKGSPYRTSPKDLVRILEIEPGVE